MEKEKTIKIIINRCYGGFNLSDDACEWLIKNKGWKVTRYNKDGYPKNESAKLILTDKPELFGKYWIAQDDDELRINKDVIECIEKLGDKADGRSAELKIVEIPDDVKWEIDEYDGIESIHEKHRSWC